MQKGNLIIPIERSKVCGYSLRIGAFYGWLNRHDYTTMQVANILHIREDELLFKLKEKEFFNKQQLRSLVYIMGAADAFFVIYFPSFQFRREVYYKVFGKEMKIHKRRKKGERKQK